ncbi:hypothetical protein PG997_000946 [Apiospora hydei]|uniref:Uncharacterized protein n=1 Tax=Apiospora hydei TaxID=1337664 RepID=A0ABR1XCA3_9PEZI
MVSSGSSRKGGCTRGGFGTNRASKSVDTSTATTDKVKSNGSGDSGSSKKMPWNDPNNKYKVDWARFEAGHPKDRPMNHNQKKRPRPEVYSD